MFLLFASTFILTTKAYRRRKQATVEAVEERQQIASLSRDEKAQARAVASQEDKMEQLRVKRDQLQDDLEAREALTDAVSVLSSKHTFRGLNFVCISRVRRRSTSCSKIYFARSKSSSIMMVKSAESSRFTPLLCISSD